MYLCNGRELIGSGKYEYLRLVIESHGSTSIYNIAPR